MSGARGGRRGSCAAAAPGRDGVVVSPPPPHCMVPSIAADVPALAVIFERQEDGLLSRCICIYVPCGIYRAKYEHSVPITKTYIYRCWLAEGDDGRRAGDEISGGLIGGMNQQQEFNELCVYISIYPSRCGRRMQKDNGAAVSQVKPTKSRPLRCRVQ